MAKKGNDWVQAPGGSWRFRLPCGETISAECAEEMNLGSPPDSAYVKVVEKFRELDEDNHRLRTTLREIYGKANKMLGGL